MLEESDDKDEIFRVDKVIIEGIAMNLAFTGNRWTLIVNAIDKFVADMDWKITSNFPIVGLQASVNELQMSVARSHPGLFAAKLAEEVLPWLATVMPNIIAVRTLDTKGYLEVMQSTFRGEMAKLAATQILMKEMADILAKSVEAKNREYEVVAGALKAAQMLVELGESLRES